MKLINYLVALVFGVSLTSCLGDASSTITQDYTPYTFNYITDQETNISSVCTDATFTIKTEQTTGLIDIDIKNLRLPSGAFISLSLKNLSYTITEQGAQHISVPTCVSVAEGGSHQITNFNLDLYLRYINSQAYYLLDCSYIVDSRYSVRVVFTPACYWGPTRVTDQDGNVYDNTNQTSFYGISYSPDKTRATIGCLNAKFADKMPAMNMNFENVPYTLTQYGFTLEASEITPTIGGVPFPSYKITDLKVSGAYGGPVNISFTCTIDSPKVKGTYKVEASLGVMPSQAS